MLVKVSVMPQSPVSPLLHSLTEDVEDCEYCVPAGRRAVLDFGLCRLSCQPGMMDYGYIYSHAIDIRLELQVAADNPFGDCDCEGQVSSSLNYALIPHFPFNFFEIFQLFVDEFCQRSFVCSSAAGGGSDGCAFDCPGSIIG